MIPTRTNVRSDGNESFGRSCRSSDGPAKPARFVPVKPTLKISHYRNNASSLHRSSSWGVAPNPTSFLCLDTKNRGAVATSSTQSNEAKKNQGRKWIPEKLLSGDLITEIKYLPLRVKSNFLGRDPWRDLSGLPTIPSNCFFFGIHCMPFYASDAGINEGYSLISSRQVVHFSNEMWPAFQLI